MLAVWWERMPERLEWELGALRAAGIDFTVDEEAREAGFIRLDLWPVINGEPLHLVATCPDLYPYFRFEVSAPDLDLEHHQHPFAKNLCFIGRATANWHIRYSLAGFIQERLEGVLEAGRSDDPDAVVGIEERQAEPFGDYYSYQRDALVLVDSGWSLPPEIPGGRLVIGVAERATRLVRGVVLEVHDADGTVLAKADPALARQYPRRLRARWLRCPGPVREGDPRRFLDSVVDRAPQLGWPEWRSVDDGRVDIVGVVYPEEVAWREAGDGWVFLVRHEGSRATGRGGRRRGRERASGIYLARAGRAGRGDLAARVPELAPLAERRVALFGLGALGAPSALALARAGVGGLRLLDQDIVEPGTTVRWPLGLPAAGLTKVADLVPFIAAHYPYTEVKGWDHRLGGVADRPFPDRLILEEMLDGTDLIVAATAEVGVHHALTDLARERGIPYLYTYVTHGYWGGLVARVRPGLTAGCWGCLQHAIDDRTIPPIPADPAEPIQPVGCANPTFPGAGFDAEQIALAAVRLAVQTLTAGAGGGYPDADWDVMTVKLRDHDGRGLAPSWDTHPLARHPRLPGMRLTVGTAWIGESVVEVLRAEADRTFPLETGGVLLGYWVRPGEEVVIVEAVGPGPGAVHRERRFRPDRDYQEAQIARRYHEFGRYHTYLGDWHTHPSEAPRLSRLDRRTLRAIARDRHARAPMPLMAILADGAPWSLVLWCCAPARSLAAVMPSRIVPLRLRTFAAMA